MATPRTQQYRPSAGSLVWGLSLLVVGGAVAQIGQYQALLSVFDPWGNGPAGEGLVFFGGVAALVGLVVTITAVHTLATNVDIATQVALDFQEARASRVVEDAPAGPAESGPPAQP